MRLWLERLTRAVWRLLANPWLDPALWGLCLALLGALSAWPEARRALGVTSWWWADGLCASRPLAVVVATIAAATLLRAAAAQPHWVPAPRRPKHRRELPLVAQDAKAARCQIEDALGKAGLAVARHAERDGVILAVAARRGAATWGVSGAALGLALMLMGGALQSLWGWENGAVMLLPEQRIALGRRPVLQIQMPATDDAIGRSVTLWDGERYLGDARIGRWRLALVGGYLLYQADDGPALRLSVTDRSGAASALLPLASEQPNGGPVHLRFTEGQEHQVALPEANLVLRLMHSVQGVEGEDSRGPFHAEILSGRDSRVLDRIAFASNTVWEIGGLRIVMAPSRYVVLRVARPIWLPFAVLGVAAATACSVMRLRRPGRRAWLQAAAVGELWQVRIVASSQILLDEIALALSSQLPTS